MAKKKKKVDLLASLENYKLVEVSRLRKAKWNFKVEDEAQAVKLANNIRRNKQLVNIIVRELPNNNLEVVDGNHRVDTFKELGIKEVVAYNLGPVSIIEAKRLSVEINETRFAADQTRLGKLTKELVAKIGMDDLKQTLPFTSKQMTQHMSTAADGVADLKKQVTQKPDNSSAILTLKLTDKDQAMWAMICKVSSLPNQDIGVFRAVCKAYLKRLKKKIKPSKGK